MPTYLLTWNPRRWPWADTDYRKEVAATKGGRLFPSQWSVGKTKRIVPGDRLFLVRQDTDRGIIGSGYATTEVFEDAHWDKSRSGETALYVEYQSDTLLPTDQRLSIEALEEAKLGVHWNNLMASGTTVPEEHCGRLEKLWERHLTKIGRRTNTPIRFPEELPNQEYVEGAAHEVVVNAYERNPKARADCLSHYGFSCAVCEFNFCETYGELGEGYIHVHHLRDLATIKRSYKVDPIKDMRPVCPNCHAMLHITSPAMPIEELRKIVKRQAS